MAPAASSAQAAAFDHIWSDPRGFVGWLRTINNIPIANRYMLTGFAFFLIGGVQALLMRIQLGTPENTFLSAERYNQLFTMHGTTMMFLFVIPFIEAVATYMLPLLLGTRDLPFPLDDMTRRCRSSCTTTARRRSRTSTGPHRSFLLSHRMLADAGF